MKKYILYVSGYDWQENIELDENLTDDEVEQQLKDMAFNHIDWGYDQAEELEGWRQNGYSETKS